MHCNSCIFVAEGEFLLRVKLAVTRTRRLRLLLCSNCAFISVTPVPAITSHIGLRPLACWDCGFESHRGHGCLSVVSVVCCQVEVSATDWSLVQRSPTDCGVSLCVFKKPRKRGGYRSARAAKYKPTMWCSARRGKKNASRMWITLNKLHC